MSLYSAEKSGVTLTTAYILGTLCTYQESNLLVGTSTETPDHMQSARRRIPTVFPALQWPNARQPLTNI